MIPRVSGVCASRHLQPTAEVPSLWESRRRWESPEQVEARHQQARIICRRCPALEACEAALSAMERGRFDVDGVMAGRFSDVRPGVSGKKLSEVQRRCLGCRNVMGPQTGPHANTRKQYGCWHAGEGLCDVCHPRLSRAARRRAVAA